MAARIAQVTLDVHDAALEAEFWSAALGLRIETGEDGCAKLYPPDDAPADVVTMWLQRVDGPKHAKLPMHLDLRPDGTVEAEVDRLIGLGAQYADVGQTDSDPFVVLADPEGNEFCVLRNEPRG